MENDERLRLMEPVAELMIEAVADRDKKLFQQAFEGADIPALVTALAAKCAQWRHVNYITRGITPVGMSKARAVEIVCAEDAP